MLSARVTGISWKTGLRPIRWDGEYGLRERHPLSVERTLTLGIDDRVLRSVCIRLGH